MEWNYFLKSVFLFEILLFTLFQNSGAIDAETVLIPEVLNDTHNWEGVRYQDVGCGNYKLNPTVSFNIQSPYFLTEDNSSSYECTWEFYGTSGCSPEITCDTFHLLDSPNCVSEFLELQDAVGGQAKFCGNDGPNEVSSTSTSILIAHFKTEVPNGENGLRCNVACASPDRVISPLSLLSTRKIKGDAAPACVSSKIVGPQPATIEEFPYQVSVQSDGIHICGGSIISANRVLTAAHCTAGASNLSLSVRVGSSIRGEGGQVIQAESICPHPGYNSSTKNNDVSVLRLANSITFDTKVQPICMAHIGYDTAIGTLGTVTGWETTSTGESLPKQLQKVEVPKVSQEDCRKTYGSSAITSSMSCYGNTQGGKNGCEGGSGGPLAINKKQVGVVSWGDGCEAGRKPGVFAKLSAETIQKHILAC